MNTATDPAISSEPFSAPALPLVVTAKHRELLVPIFQEHGLVGKQRERFLQLSAKFSLNEDAVDALVATRKDYGASLKKVEQLLEQGLNAEQVHALYRARAFIAEERGELVTFALLITFSEIFPEVSLTTDDGELLAQQVASIHFEMSPLFRNGISVWLALDRVCKFASARGISSIDTALDEMTHLHV